MTKYIETTGKTEELAVAAALEQLGLDRDDVSVEVLARAKTGFLGIGSSPAKVRVSYEAPDEAVFVPVPVPAPAPAAEEAKEPEKPAPAVKQERKPEPVKTEKKPAPAKKAEPKPAVPQRRSPPPTAPPILSSSSSA